MKNVAQPNNWNKAVSTASPACPAGGAVLFAVSIDVSWSIEDGKVMMTQLAAANFQTDILWRIVQDGAGFWSGLFGGFLAQPPYLSGGERRGFTFGLPAHGSFLGTSTFMVEAKEKQKTSLISSA